MLGSPRLSALNEEKECLTKTIDKCQNNSSYYQIQAGIDLMAKAKIFSNKNIINSESMEGEYWHTIPILLKKRMMKVFDC
ncbi:hypothetical protein Gotur_013086 [Gossypium turneri]